MLPGWRNLPTGRQVGRREVTYVYAISSQHRTYGYVGMTNNLERRLVEHNSGKNKTTKPYLPFKLIYFEKFKDRKEARTREKFLKSGSGKEFLKNI